MRIGELANLTGVPTKTIRYYEEIGVLPEPGREVNGYRSYEPGIIDRVEFIKDAQAAGLSLDEIRTVLDLRGQGASTCHHVLELLQDHLVELDDRIAALRKTRRKLADLTARAEALDPAECRDPERCQTIAPLAGRRGNQRTAAALHGAPGSR